ncbi:MAG: DUF1028 domain-containing protein [Gemmatimonadetes bacterium]|nr:DUF1028 domain-containing protein [Gemmatimonadota bacterium]
MSIRFVVPALYCVALMPATVAGQEPVAWGAHLEFSTFSIAAIDPATGESGVAVTTRVPCVGNGVPWVRAGVGAVATQASTRVEYGNQLLDMIAAGMHAQDALAEAVAGDPRAARRQVGVISLDGSRAQHTGDSTSAWAGHRQGPNYVTQGNSLVGPEVVGAVARSFESTEGSGRHLSDRLIEALTAGQAAGGDARKGRLQSAAVVVADPRPGNSRRPDRITANINVCEHPTPVAELRRIWNGISRTLGYRELQLFGGNDVWQLRVMLHALGFYRPEADSIQRNPSRRRTPKTWWMRWTSSGARMACRLHRPDHLVGIVDAATVESLWQVLEAEGKVAEVRAAIRGATLVRR